jgi:chromate transport protein ChrA
MSSTGGAAMVNAASSDSQVELILKEKKQEISGTAHPTFLEAFRFWLKLGFISFGGPTGQIAIMHQELVDRKKWVSNERFLNALNYCILLPGPEVQQLAIYSAAPVFFTEAVFFTKAAFLTFGGAYAVLPYIAQAGVEQFSWLTAEQMRDGLGLAETTPGPLIMVVQFVGFMAGWNHPGALSPAVGATIGSLVATYFTFLPGFLFIFLGAPYVERSGRTSSFPQLFPA